MEPTEPHRLFIHPNGGRIKLTAPVLALLQSYAQHKPADTEAGGVLMGRHLHGSNDIVIDAATEPMPGDRRTRYSFYRDKKRHQAALDAAWRASDGTCTYLGEWHTHPEAYPTPSDIDWKDWARRLREDSYFSELLFFIVGTEQIAAWAGRSTSLPRQPLLLLPTIS